MSSLEPNHNSKIETKALTCETEAAEINANLQVPESFAFDWPCRERERETRDEIDDNAREEK